MTYEERQAEIAQIRKEHSRVLSTPLMSEGAMGPAQLHRMSKKQHEQWQRDAQQKMALESRIRELNQSDEQIAAVQQWYDDRAKQGRIAVLTRRIDDLKRVGIGKSGKMRPTYQKELDLAEAELQSLL
jgi:hypothetical protein